MEVDLKRTGRYGLVRQGFARIRVGRNSGVAVGVAVFGILAGAMSMLGIVGIPTFVGFGVFSLFAGGAVAYRRGRGQILPENLIEAMTNKEVPYAVEYCTQATLAEACELTKVHYKDEYVAAERAERWRRKNPKAFVHLLNTDRELVASFGVLALSASFTQQFYRGNVTDHLLTEDDVLSFDEAVRSDKLYISGVVVRDPDTRLGSKRAAAMICVMVKYLEKHFGKRRRRTLYAIAVTEPSEKLMKNLGFDIACEKGCRQDNYNLYAIELTPSTWKELIARVGLLGDSSKNCECAF